jgi:hypothetical protein
MLAVRSLRTSRAEARSGDAFENFLKGFDVVYHFNEAATLPMVSQRQRHR